MTVPAVKERSITLTAKEVRAILGGSNRLVRPVEAVETCPIGQPGDRFWVRETFWCTNESCDHEYCGGCDMGSLLSIGAGYARIDYVATPECLNPPTCTGGETVALWEDAEQPLPGDWWIAPPTGWNGEGVYEGGEWNFLPWRFYTKHSSAQMPRWASRLTLNVTDVRVERTDVGFVWVVDFTATVNEEMWRA